MRTFTALAVGIGSLGLVLALAGGACNAGGSGSAFGDGNNTTTATGGQGGNTGTGNTGAGIEFDAGGGQGGSLPACEAGPDEDQDGDGWSINQGDCNDCDANMNPGAVEVIAGPDGDGGLPPPVDEDCDGQTDNEPQPCDDAVPLEVTDPMDGARAMELCKVSTGDTDWGVVQAAWVLPDGSPSPGGMNYELGHGAVMAFGPNVVPQGGVKMLGLSSGTARQPTDPGYQSVGGFDKGFTCGHPQGFPKESPACPGVITGQPHDGVALQLQIRVPTNAKGFSFDFDFYTFEWPVYICSQYNDFFVAILDPIPQGQTDGNISFDSQNNPVSVNNAFLEVCGCIGGPPCMAGGKNFPCALGNQELAGTGFGTDTAGSDHAATSWLITKAPIEDGTDVIVMRWGVYDSGDGVLDSTTLVDHWQWIATPGTQVGTEPIPPPR
jgi:hypothetical protein